MAGHDWLKVAGEIRQKLAAQGDPNRAKNEKAYMKSDLEFIGVGLPVINKAVAEFGRQHKGLGRDELWAVFVALWEPAIWEVRAVAIGLLERYVGLLGPADLPRLHDLAIECSCWAFNDSIGCRILGGIVEGHPEALSVVDRWAVDDDLWVRRVAMQSLLLPLRSGDLKEWPRFVRYAEPLVEAKDFWTRKVIGWVLRETSKKNPEPVFEFLARNRARVSGLTLREGGKYLPAPMRAHLGLGVTAASGQAQRA